MFRVVSGVLQFFAWVWMILLLVAAIIIVAVPIPWESMNYYGMDYNLQMGLYIFGWARWGVFISLLVSAVIGWAAMMAIAGMLRLLISIETNTYQSANRAPLAYPPPAYAPQPVPAPAVYASPPAPTMGVVPPPAAPTYPCNNCGAELLPGDKFCQNCGAKLAG
ncbi:MAG: zinc ribbon domain-containing protein [bacterium]